MFLENNSSTLEFYQTVFNRVVIPYLLKCITKVENKRVQLKLSLGVLKTTHTYISVGYLRINTLVNGLFAK